MWTGFQKFSRGGGGGGGGEGEGRGQTKSATVRFFPGSAPDIDTIVNAGARSETCLELFQIR